MKARRSSPSQARSQSRGDEPHDGATIPEAEPDPRIKSTPLQLQPPRRADLQQNIGRGIGQRNGWTGGGQLAVSLEDGDAGIPVQPRGEPHGAGPKAVVDVGRDRLGDSSPARGDLVQVEMLEAVLDQHAPVPLLELATYLDVREVDQRAVEPRFGGREHVLFAPASRDWLGDGLGSGIWTEGIEEGLDLGEVETEVGQHLAQGGRGLLGAVEGPKTPLSVVEALAPLAEVVRSEADRVQAIPDAPQLSPAHTSKLASWRAACRTVANCPGSVAWRSTAIGAWSSRRVLVPNSHALAVFSSKASTIMRTIL